VLNVLPCVLKIHLSLVIQQVFNVTSHWLLVVTKCVLVLQRVLESASCCPGDVGHPMVHLTVLLQRKTNYYDYIVIAPTLNLCVLTLAAFLLPCDCGWKIAIGLTVFLTLYVLQLLIAENVPDTSSLPLIGTIT